MADGRKRNKKIARFELKGRIPIQEGTSSKIEGASYNIEPSQAHTTLSYCKECDNGEEEKS